MPEQEIQFYHYVDHKQFPHPTLQTAKYRKCYIEVGLDGKYWIAQATTLTRANKIIALKENFNDLEEAKIWIVNEVDKYANKRDSRNFKRRKKK